MTTDIQHLRPYAHTPSTDDYTTALDIARRDLGLSELPSDLATAADEYVGLHGVEATSVKATRRQDSGCGNIAYRIWSDALFDAVSRENRRMVLSGRIPFHDQRTNECERKEAA